MGNTHRKTPEGYLAFGTVREQLAAKGFGTEQVDHFASDTAAGKPDMVEIICRHQGHPQIHFSFELMHKDGMKLVRAAEFNASFPPAVEAVKARKAQLQEETQFHTALGQENADAANAVLAKAGYTKLLVEADNGQMTLWHADYPEFGLHAEFPRTPQPFDTLIAHRAAAFSENYLPDHLARLTDLRNTRGITIERRHDALILTQPELGVRKAVEYIGHHIDADRWDKTLQDIDKTIGVNNDPQTMRLRLKRLAANHGFTVDTTTDTRGVTTLTLTHPSREWRPQSAPLIGTHAIPGDAAMELIAQAEAKAPTLKAAPIAPAILSAMNRAPRRPVAAKPADIDLVLDTSFLAKLSYKREGGRSFLDLLSLASHLPGIHVVIPSIVADYECQASLPHYAPSAEKVTLHTFDNAFWLLPQRRELMQQANRLLVDEHGQATLIPGSNPSLTIWHSPAQTQFYDTIRALKKTCLERGMSEKETIKHIRATYSDIGEKSILEYTQSAQSTRPAIIIAEDSMFFKQFIRGIEAFPRREDTYTRNGGHAISVGNTSAFVRAMSQEYGDSLSSALEQRYGGKEPDTSSAYIIGKMNSQRSQEIQPNGTLNIRGLVRDQPRQFYRGRDSSGDISPTLNDVIARALAYQRQNGNGTDAAQAANGTTHGHSNGTDNSHSNGHAATPPASGEAASWQDRLRSEPPTAARDLP
jgi:hypothetical protein